jgi:hypothetical protein
MIILSLTGLLALLPSCYYGGGFGITGEGPVVERKVDLPTIEGISLPGSASIYLTQGEPQSVRITGQENILDNLDLHVGGGNLEIGNKKPVWRSDPIKIYLTLKSLRSVRISGSGNVKCENHFNDLDNMEIGITGSGRIDLDVDSRDIRARISGSGDLFLNGTARDLDLVITGSGNIKAYDLQARNADARITGSGNMQLNASDRLDARVSGSGDIHYMGTPRINSSVSGSGGVRSR